MYKLIAIDLDGTLLNSNGEISSKNKQAIQNISKKGTIVVIASRKDAKFCEIFSKRNWSRQIYDLWKWCLYI